MRAYVTLLTTDNYFAGTEVLIHSLRQSGTKETIVVLVTEAVSKRIMEKLDQVADRVITVDPISNPHSSSACWNDSGYTKLRVWNLVEYDIIVYIDTDALVLESIDELFNLGVDFAAAPDVFPPDKFNAGVMVLKPCRDVFDKMMAVVHTAPSYDKGDTGFLNHFFPEWYSGPPASRLAFRYNAQRTMYWMTRAAPGYWEEAVKPIKILHFSSSPKPWDEVKKKGDLELLWWQYYTQTLIGRNSFSSRN